MIVLLILGLLCILMIIIERYIIPHLSPENRFNKWWKRYVIDSDPDHL